MKHATMEAERTAATTKNGKEHSARTMHRTKNGMPQDLRRKMVTLLGQIVADGLDLRSQVKHAHWNIRGNDFIALHRLFDEVVEGLTKEIDEVAERAAQLGGQVLGTVRMVAAESSLHEYPLNVSKSEDHIDAVSSALAQYGNKVREAVETADDAGDQGTTDLLIQLSKAMDMYLWLVESHIA